MVQVKLRLVDVHGRNVSASERLQGSCLHARA